MERNQAPRRTREEMEERGPNGRGLCTMCRTEVQGRRRTFCSDACVDEFLLLTGGSAVLRSRVWARDKGVCALCQERRERYASGFMEHRYGGGWQADHIVPIAEGGKNVMENLRTLCTGCHHKVTQELQVRLGAKTRQANSERRGQFMLEGLR